MKKETKLTFEELLMNTEFNETVNKEDSNAADLHDKTEQQANDEEIKKAVFFQNVLTNQKKPRYSEELKTKLLNRLQNAIKLEERERSRNFVFTSKTFKAAAAVILILGLSFLFSLILKNSSKNSNTLAYNEIIVPTGEKSQVILADGSKVWLNSESKLKYPVQFDPAERKVYLEGEGYFEVSKIKGSKFRVYSQNMRVEVLGTVFNVKSYPDEKTIETTVVEGKVKVEFESDNNKIAPVILLPTDRVVYNKNIAALEENSKENLNNQETIQSEPLRPITVEQVNIKNVTCWKDERLVFDNETLEEIAVKMSRWYKIKLHIDDANLRQQRFTGKFINNETIYQVLEAIDLTTPIKYSVRNNEIFVSTDKKTHRSMVK